MTRRKQTRPTRIIYIKHNLFTVLGHQIHLLLNVPRPDRVVPTARIHTVVITVIEHHSIHSPNMTFQVTCLCLRRMSYI